MNMQLTGQEIFAKCIKMGGTIETARDASYDLTVEQVVRQGKAEVPETFTVEPQEMFILISSEYISVPPGHVGYAMPKTSLCNRGLLVLNTGIIDPDYEGKLSSTVINFREKPLQLKKGEPFLRIVIHELKQQPATTVDKVTTALNKTEADKADKYVKARIQDSEIYPKTFLAIPQQIEEITKRVLTREPAQLLTILTWATVVIGLFAVFVAVIAIWYPDIRDRSGAEALLKQGQTIEKMSRTIEGLEKKLSTINALGVREHKQPQQNQPAEIQKKKNQ
jgi:deoxycytidine triphosphate deaminase